MALTQLALTACSIKAVTFTPPGDLGDAGFPDVGQAGNGPDAATTARITVTRGGGATGTVAAQGLELACAETCTATVPIGAQVTLTATPDVGAVFAGWSGGCTTSEATCTLTVTADVAVAARFDVAMLTVNVGLVGGGTGAVTWPGADTCPAICTKTVPYNTTLALSAAPAASSTFLGWGGACSGTAGCTITVTADTSVSATFAANNELDVLRAGNGSGTVTSNPAGIACGADCAESYPPGTQVTLTAAPAADSLFTGWSGGGCTGTGTCTVTMTASVMVTATFKLKQFVLTVATAGNGSGTVTSNPAGISCGADCSEPYDAHTPVTLTVAPAASSLFTGWSGACTGTGACTVTMDAAASVTATFKLKQFTLTVAEIGSGSGTVTSSPAGITCGADCSELYNFGTVVALSASSAAGSTFLGWSGACTGSGACSVTIGADTAVTAAFAANLQLVVGLAGNGSGSVTSSPAGITCGADCTEAYAPGTVVTLTASPAAGSMFAGWSGACAGTGTCQVTMTAAAMATATFTLIQFPLTVTLAGTGTGTVTSSPAGITCPGDCAEPYLPGTVVTLTASASGSSTFSGWSGACTGFTTCQVTMSAATAVTATFTQLTGTTVAAMYAPAASIAVFAAGANGDATPIRTISGSAAIGNFRSVAVANNQIVVVDQGRRAIDFFPLAGSGAIDPVRQIIGPSTGLSDPAGLLVVGNEIYVGDQSGAVLVFALTASGDAAPLRKLTGLGETENIAIDNGEIYVSDYSGNRILVFPAGASGAVAPSRIITGPTTTLGGPIGIAVVGGEIIVANINSQQILVFPEAANGDVAPRRAIAGPATGVTNPYQLSVFAGEIYAAIFSTQTVLVFRISDNGNVPPVRKITGPSTKLGSVAGVTVF